MAESRKKLADCLGSINVSSAEDFDCSCEPCLTAGRHTEALGFCLDCRVYICNICFKKHQKTKASKHHRLLDKDDIDKKDLPKMDPEVCTEECHRHKYEMLKFFCLQHEELACHDCVALNHRTCDLDYIPDKCADIGDSEELRRTEWLLSKGMAEVNNVKQKATKRRKEIDTHHQDLINSIDKYQKEINDRIQQIRNEIKKEIDKKDSLNKQTVQSVLDSCTASSSENSQLQTKLQESKTKKQNGKLYITIKQATCMLKLKADEIKKSEEELDKVHLQNIFEPNPDLQALLSKREGFGKLSLIAPWKNQVKLTEKDIYVRTKHEEFGNLTLCTRFVTPLKEVNLTQKKEIPVNIRTESDKSLCSITGCAVLSPNKIVLADCNNNKLKVLDTKSNHIVEEIEFDSSPLDVTTLPHDQIAVTFPNINAILTMTSKRRLCKARTIDVKGLCRGIFYHKENLFTVCNEPNAVVILDKKGTVHNTISLNTEQLKAPYHIAVSEDSRLLMYVSDTTGKIVSITLLGEISAANKDFFPPRSAVYKNLFRPQSAVYKNPLGPAGMTVLDDGSLLMCCTTGSIYHFSADLKQCQNIISGLKEPCSICYNHNLNEIYVGGRGYDKLEVFSLTFV